MQTYRITNRTSENATTYKAPKTRFEKRREANKGKRNKTY